MSAHRSINPAEAFAHFEAELNEVLKHKYFESEKAGRDIGFEQALQSWAANHRQTWRAQHFEKK